MVERAYLRGLEEVEERIDSGVSCVAGCVPLLIAFVWLVYTGGSWKGWAALLTVIALVVLYTRLFASRLIRADRNGVEIRTRVRRRFVAWQDVLNAESVSNGQRPGRIRLSTARRTLTFPRELASHPRLEASIWQYLNGVGKADRVELSEDAKSIWYPIPDSVPEEMEWEPTGDTQRQIGQRRFVLTRHCVSQTPIGELGEGMWHDNVLVQQPEGELVVRWDDVSRAYWDYEGDRSVLVLAPEGRPDFFWIPLVPEDPVNKQFLLGMIRQLRELEKVPPVEMPEELREMVRP